MKNRLYVPITLSLILTPLFCPSLYGMLLNPCALNILEAQYFYSKNIIPRKEKDKFFGDIQMKEISSSSLASFHKQKTHFAEVMLGKFEKQMQELTAIKAALIYLDHHHKDALESVNFLSDLQKRQ